MTETLIIQLHITCRGQLGLCRSGHIHSAVSDIAGNAKTRAPEVSSLVDWAIRVCAFCSDYLYITRKEEVINCFRGLQCAVVTSREIRL
jgi:hypothetical protein